MNSPIEQITSEPPGPFIPQCIAPEETESDTAASPILEYSPPPIDKLPAPLADYAAKSAEALGCDPCLVAMPMLAVCAAAIGDSRAIQVKAGWIEFPILWTLAIAASGALKTPAMKAAMVGLEEAQRIAFEQFRLAEAQHKEAVAKWRSEGMKSEEPTPPRPTSYYVSDATIQAVCKQLAHNPRGLLQKRDELSGWLGGFDQFTKGGNEAAQWLEFHSGGSVMLGVCLNQLAATDEVKCLVPNGGCPARLRWADFKRRHGVHNVLPSPGAQGRVAVLQVNLRDLQIHS